MGRTREVLPNWKRWGWSLSGILCLPTKPLDAAAAAAHGWAADASDGDVLRESLALNGGARGVQAVMRCGPLTASMVSLVLFDLALQVAQPAVLDQQVKHLLFISEFWNVSHHHRQSADASCSRWRRVRTEVEYFCRLSRNTRKIL